jgi:hypothetical protein
MRSGALATSVTVVTADFLRCQDVCRIALSEREGERHNAALALMVFHYLSPVVFILSFLQ